LITISILENLEMASILKSSKRNTCQKQIKILFSKQTIIKTNLLENIKIIRAALTKKILTLKLIKFSDKVYESCKIRVLLTRMTSNWIKSLALTFPFRWKIKLISNKENCPIRTMICWLLIYLCNSQNLRKGQ